MTKRLHSIVDPYKYPKSQIANWSGHTEQCEDRSKVCAFIVAQNDEVTLGQCLSRVAPFVDQIIVVDNGSQDRTSVIAREYGAEVCVRGPFEELELSQNTALRRVKADWILSLFPSELVSEIAIERIRSCIVSAPPEVLALGVHVAREVDSCNLELLPSELRVFRRIPELAFEPGQNERHIPVIKRTNFQVIQIPILLNSKALGVSVTGLPILTNKLI
jgi:cellulose synthase/poly-beta-1,6-N-acetylglucosamine synthase-like glycosyltransferase